MRRHRKFVPMLAALALACSSCRTASGPAQSSAPPSASTPTPAASVPAGPSLYELEMDLTTQSGAEVKFDVFRGKPVILAMFYATCPSACPVLMEDIKRLEGRLPEDVRQRTRVLLVSLDPERDEPEILMKAAERHSVDQSRWILARASDEKARELAVILGVKYRGMPDGEIDHSSALYLLDGDGVIVEKVEGLGQPADSIEQRLRAM